MGWLQNTPKVWSICLPILIGDPHREDRPQPQSRDPSGLGKAFLNRSGRCHNGEARALWNTPLQSPFLFFEARMIRDTRKLLNDLNRSLGGSSQGLSNRIGRALKNGADQVAQTQRSKAEAVD
ncbi:MAG: hypothetical protein HC818_01485 [Synechococcaceae cyanobacterium RM1_1_27]|nr:hypothetical protein [Synechococcaceae cyanobacterium RM1_1_27]